LQVRKPDGALFTGYDAYKNGFQDGFQLDANPRNPDTIVLAGGWQWNNTGDGAISRDNGRTFRVFASKPFPDAKFGRIAVGANPDNIVWAPMGTGDTPVYFSKDGGETWAESAGSPRGTVATDGPWSFYKMLAADRVLDGHFTLYDHRDGRVFQSTDGGATWQHVSTLPKQLGVHYDAHKLQFAPATPGLLWAALSEQGLFQSSDGGQNWKRVPNISWARALAWGKGASPAKPTAFLFGQIGGKTPKGVEDAELKLYRSDDGGSSWTPISDDANGFPGSGSIEGDKQVAGRVYVATGGRGVFYGVPALIGTGR